MKPIFLIGLAAIWMTGCAPVEKKAAPAAKPSAQSNAAPPEKSVTRQAVEGFTGKTSVDAGQRTKAKIKAIETQRQENFEGIPP